MATVTHSIVLPDGSIPATVYVKFELVGSTGVPLTTAYVTSSGQAIDGFLEMNTATGLWSVALTNNSLITPANSYYRVTHVINNRATYVDSIRATGTSGTLASMLVQAPASLPNAASQTYTDSVMALHVAAVDPHPVYMTAAEVAAAAAASSVALTAPSNTATPQIIWEASTSAATNSGKFRWFVDETTMFSAQRDPVMRFGYNVGPGGSRLVAAEPSSHWQLEAHYYDGVDHWIESFWEYQTSTGVIKRPIGFNGKRDSPYINFSLTFDTLMWTDSSGYNLLTTGGSGDTGFFVWRANIYMQSAAAARTIFIQPTGGDAQIIMDAPVGSSHRLKFTRAGVDQFQIYNANSASTLFFRDEVNSRMLASFFGGASSTASQVQWLAIQRYNDATLWQTTVGAAGAASALPATPTKYLKVQDNTGATYVIPAYAP